MKKGSQLIVLTLVITGGLVVFNACTHEPEDISSFREICFDSEILPIFTSNCALSGCHSSGSGKEGYTLNSFSTITSRGILPGDARSSELYTVLFATGESQMPPSGVLPESQRTLIRIWIDQGAKNTSCDPSGNDPGGGTSSEGVCFETDILPLIVSNCAMAGCHDAVSHEEGYNFTSYDNILKAVRAGKPQESKLYKSVTEKEDDFMPPPPNTPLTASQVTTIYNWILEGAKNTTCDTCDPTQFAYAADISPLVTNYCKGCHSGSAPSGNIRLESYNDLKSIALSGQLMGSLTGASGFSLMPPAGKLQDCQIEQIGNWVAANTPDN